MNGHVSRFLGPNETSPVPVLPSVKIPFSLSPLSPLSPFAPGKPIKGSGRHSQLTEYN
jgi:hypothetical protein